jgi:hypothetical protein
MISPDVLRNHRFDSSIRALDWVTLWRIHRRCSLFNPEGLKHGGKWSGAELFTVV